MPRIKQNRLQYMKKDFYKNISGDMKVKRVRQQEIADELGMSQQSFSDKLKKGNFKYTELVFIFHKLEKSDNEILELMKI